MKKINILYVEDDTINAFIMERLISDFYDVTVVSDGEKCLELLKNKSFPLILMDIHLGKGKMDGVQVLKVLRSNEDLASIPVIAVTSYALPDDRDRFLKEGFNQYIPKPVEKDIILQEISKLLTPVVND